MSHRIGRLDPTLSSPAPSLIPLEETLSDLAHDEPGRSFSPTPEQLIPELDRRMQLVLLARTLWSAGYNDEIAGHITINLHDGTLLCNPWTLVWEELYPHHVLRVDLDGNVLEGNWPVPPGILLHLELHKLRPDVEIAMHNHPMFGTVWADMREVPPPMDQSAATGGGDLVLVDEYGGGVNDPETAHAAVEEMGDADMALLCGHGVFLLGETCQAVYHRAISLEVRCQRAWMIRAAGGRLVSPLPESAIERWRKAPGGLHGLWEAAVRRELRSDPALLAT